MPSSDTQNRPHREDEHVRVTNSLPLMAYFMMHGIQLAKAVLEGEPKRYCFYYLDPDGASDSLEVLWINSDCHRFDSFLKSLRDLIGGKQNRKQRKQNRQWTTRSGNGKASRASARQ